MFDFVPLYTAPPELAELQATIAQQKNLIESLRNDMREAISIDCGDDAMAAMAEVERFGTPGDVIREMNDEMADFTAEIERLKGGRCEPFGYWLYPKNLPLHGRFSKPDPDMQSAAVVEAFDITPLYTSQPTPVSVVLPDLPVDWRTRFEEDQDSNEDGVASFSPDSYMQDEIDELRAWLDKFKELNQ